VVPVVSYRIAPFKHEVRICEPLPMVKTQDSEESLRENTATMNRALEKMILARPEQWLWLHRRWRY
jgi:KDO2-lipid IV(A) lauroyltransferase